MKGFDGENDKVILIFHAVSIPHIDLKVKFFLCFYFVFFLNFLLDTPLSINLRKSLSINELRRGGMPAPRNSLSIKELRGFLLTLELLPCQDLFVPLLELWVC